MKKVEFELTNGRTVFLNKKIADSLHSRGRGRYITRDMVSIPEPKNDEAWLLNSSERVVSKEKESDLSDEGYESEVEVEAESKPRRGRPKKESYE